MESWQEYAKKIVEIIRFYGEMNETDSVCFIERNTLDPSKEDILEHLAANKYESHHSNELKILKLNVYDKIIIFDCASLKKEFFQHAFSHLEKTEGKLMIIMKLQNWISKFNDEQYNQFVTERRSLFRDLLDAGFNIQWDVINVAVNMNSRRWFENVKHCSEHLIHDINALIKYVPFENENVRVNEQLLIIIASPRLRKNCEFKSIKQSPKSKNKLSNKRNLYQNTTNIWPLCVTPQLKDIVNEQLSKIVLHSMESLNKQYNKKTNQGARQQTTRVSLIKIIIIIGFKKYITECMEIESIPNLLQIAPKNVLPNTQTAVELLMQDCYTYVRSFDILIDDNANEPYLILIDPRNGNAEVERFRIDRVLYPRYRTTPPEVCPVNNLLTFTIKAGSMDRGRPIRNEIHLFQVLTCPAQTIVNAMMKAGAIDNDSHDQGVNDSMLISRAPSEPNLRMPLQTRSAEIPSTPLITKEDSVYSESQINREWIDLEVSLLNHCFDDIERFLQMLKSKTKRQFTRSLSVATSSKSKSRISSVALNEGSGSLTDEHFLAQLKDFFEKFKFACILLARLENYVVDPNSAALLRQLFDILRYTIESTRSPDTDKADAARKTIYPRLPLHATLFVQSNLTQEYNKLWLSLGKEWNTPREQYVNDKFVYIPRFENGFTVWLTDKKQDICYNQEVVTIQINLLEHHMKGHKMVTIDTIRYEFTESAQKSLKTSFGFP
ncbi:unnamed protein product [Schistosoma turkestanicum]|nr:unnamed protein product [Schistosoma turkestanicum]